MLFLRPDDYPALKGALERRGDQERFIYHLDQFGRSNRTPCVYFPNYDRDPDSTDASLKSGVSFIRHGLPEKLARACVEEELSQAMGLFFDHPENRPSIFNDDQEFALLTEHDKLLLRILYDPRLRSGMGETEAMPIVRKIASDLIGEPAS